jgi:hypothetical protein
MCLMDQRCLFLVDLFQVYILYMQRLQRLKFLVLSLTEKAKESNMEKNKKKWDGQYSQQL